MEFIKSVEIHEEDNFEATAVIRFTERMEVLSSAPRNGGHAVTDTVFIMQVPHDYVSADYRADLEYKASEYSLPADAVGFMTAAEVKYVFTDCEKTVDGETVYVASTAGVTNCVCAGDRMEGWEHRKARSDEIYRRLIAGTINTVVVTSRPLTDPAKINLMIPLVEGKTLAMRDLGYEETGTTSDAMAVVSPIGDERCEFAGTGTPLGMAAAQGVRETVAGCIRSRGESPEPLDCLAMLEKQGVTKEMLWDCASACGLEEELTDRFWDVFDSMETDPDICSLVYASLAAGRQADLNCIYNQMEGEYPDMLVDGTLAMFLAGRISETRGGDATIDLLRMRPLKDSGLAEYIENTVYGLVAGVVGYITGYTDE